MHQEKQLEPTREMTEIEQRVSNQKKSWGWGGRDGEAVARGRISRAIQLARLRIQAALARCAVLRTLPLAFPAL